MESDTSKKTFLTGDHPLTEVLNQMFKKYIPLSGPTNYLETECFRAVQRLLREYHHNGGANPKGNEVNFLLAHGKEAVGLGEKSLNFFKSNVHLFERERMWSPRMAEGVERALAEVLLNLMDKEVKGIRLTRGKFDCLDEKYNYVSP